MSRKTRNYREKQLHKEKMRDKRKKKEAARRRREREMIDTAIDGKF